MADDDLLSLDFTSFTPSPPAPTLEDALPPAVIEESFEPAAPPPLPVAETAPALPLPSYVVPVLPAALVEAAELHASGQEIEACRRLEQALKSNENLGDAAERVWQALFELLQSLGRRQAFDTLALVYAKRFELSPPAWAAPLEEADHVNASAGGRAHATLAGTLNARVGDALKQMMKLALASPLVRIDVARITDADNDGATLLLRALAALRKARKEYLFGSPEHLADLLAAKLEPGRRENEAMWLLLLELLQQAWRQDAFEEAAVNYAVTFELSPPSYVAPAPGKAPPVAVVVEPVAPPRDAYASVLRGQLLGAAVGEFADLHALAATGAADELADEVVEINALALVCVDAASAEHLRQALAGLQSARRRVRIVGLSQLVFAFLVARGLAAHAELRSRKA